MIYKVDFKEFIVEFKDLIARGVSFWDALQILVDRYGSPDHEKGKTV